MAGLIWRDIRRLDVESFVNLSQSIWGCPESVASHKHLSQSFHYMPCFLRERFQVPETKIEFSASCKLLKYLSVYLPNLHGFAGAPGMGMSCHGSVPPRFST